MNKLITTLLLILGLGLCPPAFAGERSQMTSQASRALQALYAHTPGARALAENARGILVFPEVTKGGFIIGGQYGKGVLFKQGAVAGFYSTTAASYGLQAGLEKFGYALFFMTEADLAYLKNSKGWEVGVGPTLTIVDQGAAAQLSTTTGRSGVYAFFFAQKGLMAGIGFQGTKITRIQPKN
jgi:lipid-binding SYLF domain-containing protein